MLQTLVSEPDRRLRQAHDRAFRYPDGFPGYSARLLYEAEGARAAGAVTLAPGRSPDVRLDDDLAEDERGWLEHELGMMAGHRWHRPYEEADGRWEKRLVEDGHPLGDLVELDDSMASAYRLRDGEITTIARTHAGTRFTITIQSRTPAPDGRIVSNAFTVVYHGQDAEELGRADVYTDEHETLGDLLLPRARTVVTASGDGLRVRRFELSAHAIAEVER